MPRMRSRRSFVSRPEPSREPLPRSPMGRRRRARETRRFHEHPWRGRDIPGILELLVPPFVKKVLPEFHVPRPMTEDLLPSVTIEPDPPATHAVLWLHGLGADGHDFEPIVPELKLPRTLAVRFVFPHAPSIPVTINGGMRMPAWYDIALDGNSFRHDEEGIRRSQARLEALIAHEKERGVPAERIVLAGFSQGGAIALHTGLRHAEPLAGILALSTYLPFPDELEEERSEANLETPIFQAHGTYDTMVVLPRGEESRDRLRELGHIVSFATYPMAHQVCAAEIDDVGRWLEQVFA